MQEKEKIILRLEEVVSESEKKLLKRDYSKKEKTVGSSGLGEEFNNDGENLNENIENLSIIEQPEKKIVLKSYTEAILNTEFEIAKETNERIVEMKKKILKN